MLETDTSRYSDYDTLIADDPKQMYFYLNYKAVLKSLEDVFFLNYSMKLSECGKFLTMYSDINGNTYEIHARGIENNDFSTTKPEGNATVKIINGDSKSYVSQKMFGGTTYYSPIPKKGNHILPRWELMKFRNAVIYANMHANDFCHYGCNFKALTLYEDHMKEMNNLHARKTDAELTRESLANLRKRNHYYFIRYYVLKVLNIFITRINPKWRLT